MQLATQKIEYRPRSPEEGILHRVVRDHLEDFLLEAEHRFDNGLPDFVEEEMRRFLGCGHLASGFVRLKCGACGHERFVPFSCKRRAICPSCAGRRMAERAAHLVEEVFPPVAVRQWVLSLPFALRYKMAWNHELELRVLRVFWRSVEKNYRKRAEERGLVDAHTGGVTVIQRAGGALNLNPHFHTAVLDGVFTEDENGHLTFHRHGAPKTEDVVEVIKDARKRVLKMLGRDTVSFDDDEDAWNDKLSAESPALAAVSIASVHQLVAFGERAGCRVLRIEEPSEYQSAGGKVESRRKRHARYQGFDLHAGAALNGKDRKRLERLLRYLLRPPVAESRLKELRSGKIMLKLKRRWRDGTRSIVFEPIELVEKLAAIIPRPHVNQIIYHGALGARYKSRKKVVGYGRPPEEVNDKGEILGDPDQPRYINWAELMRRTFGLDVLACEKCAGRMKIVALIDQPSVIEKILKHLGLPTEIPQARPARAPPHENEFDDLNDAVQLDLDLDAFDGVDDPGAFAE